MAGIVITDGMRRAFLKLVVENGESAYGGRAHAAIVFAQMKITEVFLQETNQRVLLGELIAELKAEGLIEDRPASAYVDGKAGLVFGLTPKGEEFLRPPLPSDPTPVSPHRNLADQTALAAQSLVSLLLAGLARRERR